MPSLRDERAAVLRRWHRDMGDNFTAVLPRVLDDLDALDRAQVPDGIIKFDIPGAVPMTDQEIREFAKQWLEAKDGPAVQRALGVVAGPGTGSVPPPGPVPPVPVSDKPPKAPPAARTATRRRTTR